MHLIMKLNHLLIKSKLQVAIYGNDTKSVEKMIIVFVKKNPKHVKKVGHTSEFLFGIY